MYEDPAEALKESKEEFADAAKMPGIHLTNPTTPLVFSLPGGLDEFPHVYMEATLRPDVSVATFEWWWTKSQDYLPQLEVQTEQYKPGALNYSMDNFRTRNEAIPEKYFQLKIGQRHLIKFFFDVKDRYLVVKIDGMHALFELIEQDAKRYDQLRITGAFDIHIFRALHEKPLPMPLTVPLTPEELLKGDRLQIKGKNIRKAQQISLRMGDTALPVSMDLSKEDFDLVMEGDLKGLGLVRQDDAPPSNCGLRRGVSLATNVIIDGDVDVNWVIIDKLVPRTNLQKADSTSSSDG